MATVYGYARVSSRDQNLNRQLDALSAYGVEAANVFADRASGKDFDRPRYRELLRALASGDVLVVLSIDRLGRNYSEILEEWRRITKELGAAIVVLDMPLLDTRARDCGGSDVTSTLIAGIVLQLLSYVAQVERENIHRRQAEGIAAARARGRLPPPLKILVHMHAGGGFENASLIEALLNGADGAWGGLPKRAAIIGHASLGELIANLVRVGNPNMRQYRLDRLLPLATNLQELDDEAAVPDDLPILGHNAYRLPLSFFRQLPGRFMDLPPEAIGGTYRYRVCPLVSDTAVIAGRLAEVLCLQADGFREAVLEQMIFIMRRDLRAGERIAYDEPDNLKQLYARALRECEPPVMQAEA